MCFAGRKRTKFLSFPLFLLSGVCRWNFERSSLLTREYSLRTVLYTNTSGKTHSLSLPETIFNTLCDSKNTLNFVCLFFRPIRSTVWCLPDLNITPQQLTTWFFSLFFSTLWPKTKNKIKMNFNSWAKKCDASTALAPWTEQPLACFSAGMPTWP